MFGSCVVAGRSGVVLQNRAAYFSLDPAHPNCVAPGKTPLHTLIASLARCGTDNTAVGRGGLHGRRRASRRSTRRPTWRMIDHGLDIQQAVQAPRWLSGRFALGEARDTLHIEARFAGETIAELERRGHVIDRWGEWNELGRACAWDRRSTRRPARAPWAAADPRRRRRGDRVLVTASCRKHGVGRWPSCDDRVDRVECQRKTSVGSTALTC